MSDYLLTILEVDDMVEVSTALQRMMANGSLGPATLGLYAERVARAQHEKTKAKLQEEGWKSKEEIKAFENLVVERVAMQFNFNVRPKLEEQTRQDQNREIGKQLLEWWNSGEPFDSAQVKLRVIIDSLLKSGDSPDSPKGR